MVNDRSRFNIITLQTLSSVGLTVKHLKNISMAMQGSNQSEQRPMGKFTIKARFSEIEDFNELLVINVDTSYNLLLDRPWMHKISAVPST